MLGLIELAGDIAGSNELLPLIKMAFAFICIWPMSGSWGLLGSVDVCKSEYAPLP